ncbi:MAG: DUF91 domain-containing protein [Chloroflexi bacterium]|nr:DUF91 domain-containing protein [Chloroflexota bacterium]
MVIRFDKDLTSSTKLEPVSLEDLKLKESWLQDLVAKMARDIVGEPLLVIMREFKGFGTKERPDILAIDKQGSLVIIELKRGQATEDAAIQAVKYAAYCFKLKSPNILSMFAQYVREQEIALEAEGPREAMIDFLEGSEEALDSLNRRQRIILIAAGFDERVSAVASWLSLNQVNIRCISLNAYRDPADHLLLHPDQFLPPPEITTFLPGLPEAPTTVLEKDVEANIVDPFVRGLVSGLKQKLASHPFDGNQVQVNQRSYDFRVRMFGKNRAGYYFAKRWLRFYLYSPTMSEVEAVNAKISDKESVNQKAYDIG